MPACCGRARAYYRRNGCAARDAGLTAPPPILPSVPGRTESAEIDRFRFHVPRV